MARLALLIVVAGLALAACGPLPRPFQPEEKLGNPLLDLPDGTGIVVQPLAGAPTAGGQVLAEALAARLRDLAVPAATDGGNLGSRRLFGRAAVERLPGGREAVLLYWELRDADGGRAGTLTQRREQAAGTWAAGAPALLETLAAAAAPEIAAMVQEPTLGSSPRGEAAAIPGFPGARLVVLNMPDAPGDAAESLPQALEWALQAAKLPVSDRIGEGDLLVLGKVTLGPRDGGLQAVAVRWSVVSARDDRELGEVAQQNVVPAGSLDGPWGPLADEIARAAAAGLLDLLGQAGKQ